MKMIIQCLLQMQESLTVPMALLIIHTKIIICKNYQFQNGLTIPPLCHRGTDLVIKSPASSLVIHFILIYGIFIKKRHTGDTIWFTCKYERAKASHTAALPFKPKLQPAKKISDNANWDGTSTAWKKATFKLLGYRRRKDVHRDGKQANSNQTNYNLD